MQCFVYFIFTINILHKLPDLTLCGDGIHFASNGTVKYSGKILIVLKRLVCSNGIRSMFIRKLNERVSLMLKYPLFLRTESLIVPLKGFEQNERPALIKNRASDENCCRPGRIGL